MPCSKMCDSPDREEADAGAGYLVFFRAARRVRLGRRASGRRRRLDRQMIKYGDVPGNSAVTGSRTCVFRKVKVSREPVCNAMEVLVGHVNRVGLPTGRPPSGHLLEDTINSCGKMVHHVEWDQRSAIGLAHWCPGNRADCRQRCVGRLAADHRKIRTRSIAVQWRVHLRPAAHPYPTFHCSRV